MLSETSINKFVPGYYHLNYKGTPIIKSENGGFYVFTNLNPIFDTIDINYQGYLKSKIVMDKLDENPELVYSKEMTIPLDTTGIWDEIDPYNYP